MTKQTFTVGNGMAAGSNYQNALRNIEAKVQQMLKANLKADMTIYQQTWALREAYEGSVSYKQEAHAAICAAPSSTERPSAADTPKGGCT